MQSLLNWVLLESLLSTLSKKCHKSSVYFYHFWDCCSKVDRPCYPPSERVNNKKRKTEWKHPFFTNFEIFPLLLYHMLQLCMVCLFKVWLLRNWELLLNPKDKLFEIFRKFAKAKSYRCANNMCCATRTWFIQVKLE